MPPTLRSRGRDEAAIGRVRPNGVAVRDAACPAVPSRRVGAAVAAEPAAPVAQLVPQASVAPIVVVEPAPAPANDDEPTCSVCLDALSSKFAVTCDPCAHAFHQSCTTKWLETRCCMDAQQCPLCRTDVNHLMDGDTQLPRVRPYGDYGQPTKKRVLFYAHHCGVPTMDHLNNLHEEVREWMREIRRSRALAVQRGGPEDYLEDADLELKKLADRAKIFREMKLAWRRGAMRMTQNNVRRSDVDEPWDYAGEMEDLRQSSRDQRNRSPMHFTLPRLPGASAEEARIRDIVTRMRNATRLLYTGRHRRPVSRGPPTARERRAAARILRGEESDAAQ